MCCLVSSKVNAAVPLLDRSIASVKGHRSRAFPYPLPSTAQSILDLDVPHLPGFFARVNFGSTLMLAPRLAAIIVPRANEGRASSHVKACTRHYFDLTNPSNTDPALANAQWSLFWSSLLALEAAR